MSGGAARAAVAVVGSANLDVILAVDELPEPGQTVLSQGVRFSPGGKGLNQAVAAARAETIDISFIGSIGQDDAGERILTMLQSNSVDTTYVTVDAERSGRAYVTVSRAGENSIVVDPQANAVLQVAAVLDALNALTPRVVLAQLEIDVAAVEAAAAWCDQYGCRFILNPSPARSLGPDVIRLADPLIVNKGEAESILGRRESSADELAAQLALLATSVVVTAGAEGAYIAQEHEVLHVAAATVDVIDTTGAGDCFAGTLASALAVGRSLPAAVASANQAAGVLVRTRREDR